MAGVTRNYQLDPFPATIAIGGIFMSMTGNPVNAPAEASSVDSDAQFKNRPPNGNLYFRTFDGNWVD